MNNPIIIAIDAMGGENSPKKVVEGICIHSKNSNNVNYKIFGDEKLIIPYIDKFKINKSKIEIIHTNNLVEDKDSALGAAKKGKDTSLWLSIESLKNNGCLIMPKKNPSGDQRLILVKKNNETYLEKELLSVRFVPLLNKIIK